jgi:hypothetical protein
LWFAAAQVFMPQSAAVTLISSWYIATAGSIMKQRHGRASVRSRQARQHGQAAKRIPQCQTLPVHHFTTVQGPRQRILLATSFINKSTTGVVAGNVGWWSTSSLAGPHTSGRGTIRMGVCSQGHPGMTFPSPHKSGKGAIRTAELHGQEDILQRGSR